MDEPEQLIDPVVVENAVERIRGMPEAGRSQLALQLVRFLAVLYAENLRMLNNADQGDAASLLQVQGGVKVNTHQNRQQTDQLAKAWVDNGVLEEAEEMNFMQQAVDKFGMLLQKLLGLLEKTGHSKAALRASFLLSILADVQRPGTHISAAAVVDKMDRLQALLLSQDEDRDWCFRQWEILQPVLFDKKPDQNSVSDVEDQAAGSTHIVCLEDSQETGEDASAPQIAILANGTTRPLTSDEIAEIACREELERSAAEHEARADGQRWLQCNAKCLCDEEDAVMKEALTEGSEESPRKRARVKIQIEGEGGRIVRSEVFNMVVKESESLTYKIVVLPRDDLEVQALRHRQALRDRQAM